MDQEERPARQTEERGGVRRRKLEARAGSVRGRGRMGLDIGERRVEPRGHERRDEDGGAGGKSKTRAAGGNELGKSLTEVSDIFFKLLASYQYQVHLDRKIFIKVRFSTRRELSARLYPFTIADIAHQFA